MKVIMLSLVLSVVPVGVLVASGYHHDHYVVVQENTTINESSHGTALGIAMGQGQCDLSSDKWQASVGAGYYDGAEAVAAGLCKGYGGATLNGKVGRENGKTGYGIGASWKF